jgi:hypothetical protein
MDRSTDSQWFGQVTWSLTRLQLFIPRLLERLTTLRGCELRTQDDIFMWNSGDHEDQLIFGGLGLQKPSISLFSDKHKMIGEEIGFPFCCHLWSPVVTCGHLWSPVILGRWRTLPWVFGFWHFGTSWVTWMATWARRKSQKSRFSLWLKIHRKEGSHES